MDHLYGCFSYLDELFSRSSFYDIACFWILMDHIWMLLLLQRIFWEGQVLMLLDSIVDHLWTMLLFVLEYFFGRPRILPLLFKISFTMVFLQMDHNKELFKSSRFKYRTFSKGPIWSDLFPLCSCNRWKPAINCPKIVVYTVKIVKFLVRIISEHSWCLKLKLLDLACFENWRGEGGSWISDPRPVATPLYTLIVYL